MSGTPRPPGLRKLHSKNGNELLYVKPQEKNALVVVYVLIPQTLDEGVHVDFLVRLDVKETREATPGEATRDLRYSRRTADTCDIGTCENYYDGPVRDLCLCLCTAP